MSTAGQKLAAVVRGQPRPEAWHVAEVSAVNGDGTVDISYLGIVDDHIACLNGFVPSTGDLVLLLTSSEIGSIVFGRIPRRSVPDA